MTEHSSLVAFTFVFLLLSSQFVTSFGLDENSLPSFHRQEFEGVEKPERGRLVLSSSFVHSSSPSPSSPFPPSSKNQTSHSSVRIYRQVTKHSSTSIPISDHILDSNTYYTKASQKSILPSSKPPSVLNITPTRELQLSFHLSKNFTYIPKKRLPISSLTTPFPSKNDKPVKFISSLFLVPSKFDNKSLINNNFINKTSQSSRYYNISNRFIFKNSVNDHKTNYNFDSKETTTIRYYFQTTTMSTQNTEERTMSSLYNSITLPESKQSFQIPNSTLPTLLLPTKSFQMLRQTTNKKRHLFHEQEFISVDGTEQKKPLKILDVSKIGERTENEETFKNSPRVMNLRKPVQTYNIKNTSLPKLKQNAVVRTLWSTPQRHYTTQTNDNSPRALTYMSSSYQSHFSSDQRQFEPLSTSTPQTMFDPSSPTNISAQLGSSAYLPCKIRNLGNKTVSWIRNRDSHILTVDRYTFIADERFQAWHEEDSDTWTLMVKYVQERDDGRYECQVSTEPKMSYFVYFHVVSPIVRIPGGSDIYVKVGSNVSLKCIISAALKQPDYIFWYKGNERVVSSGPGQRQIFLDRISNDSSVGTLVIPHATTKDAGLYQCVPEKLRVANVTLHVINGEHPAAMQHGTSVMTSPGSPVFLLSSLLLLVA